MTEGRLVYLDNAATTPVDARVAQAALAAMTESWGNPSSAHRLGAEAARLVARAREQLARALGCAAGELTFTSGGTEANALALQGATQGTHARHLVLSGFEHASVAETARALAGRGLEVTVVAPSARGVVDPDAFAAAVRPDTTLAALVWVQNEIGTVQPVAEAARAIKARAPRCHVHVDGVQALGKLPVDLGAAPFDSLAVSAHKIHGPKGVGALWLRRGSSVRPLVHGGGQERGLRPGTEGVPAIVALGLAAELAVAARPEAAVRMAALRDRLWDGVRALAPRALRHGDADAAAPHILALGFPGVPAEPLLHALEAEEVYVSAGSACSAKDRKPSATLRALGVPDDVGTLRFSLSRLTGDEDIARAVAAVHKALEALA